MPTMGLSTHHIDYLQRSFELPHFTLDQRCTSAPAPMRRLWHVRGVGKLTRGPRSPQPDGQIRNLMRDALIGVYGSKIPIGFLIQGTTNGICLRLGVWSPSEREKTSSAMLNARADILASVLNSLYPDIDLMPSDPSTPVYTLAGLVLGQPSCKPPEIIDHALPLDRMIRALYGTNWGALILADPIEESFLLEMRNNVLNELRAIQSETQSMAASNPVSELYQQFLKSYLVDYTRGQAEGAWRTAVYLLGESSSYYRLASVWRSIFSGDESVAQPVRVIDHSPTRALAQNWSLPDVDGMPGPGSFHHPFSFQSLLTSSQLANYIQLPEYETSGFYIRLVPNFDSVPAENNEPEDLGLGQVIDRTHLTSTVYRLSRKALNRHALIAGVTGAGKTNTIFHLLTQLWERGLAFLVLEPAKMEYRALLDHPSIGGDLQVFTPGDETVSPLRLNPFEFEKGISVTTHIDLLKSVFNASFGMWNPLPQILERCIHAVYADCGWDSARGGNDRLDGGQWPPNDVDPQAFPTLTQLCQKVEEIVDGLKYDDRVSSDIKAALMTRLNSLRVGAKGMMLDTHRSVPLAELLNQPTIIELENIGDDDEKAFVMGLLLIRIYEHLRGQGVVEGKGLSHLTVIEEAHRLLANVPPSNNPEQANTRGKAVETFANMLSEVRAYGESFLVAEQIPSKLSPDVMKNTNIKVVHRVVSEDDRRALGGTMNMGEDQIEMLATLRTGQAAVFSEGDDKPLLVQVPYSKLEASNETATRRGSDARLAARMADFRLRKTTFEGFVPHALCASACGQPYLFCNDAKPLVEFKFFQQQFSALVLTVVLDETSLPGRLSELQTTMRSHLPTRAMENGAYACVILNAVEWFITDFGRHYHWKYATARQLQQSLSTCLVDTLQSLLGGKGGDSKAQARFAATYNEACRRRQDPFLFCAQVCPQGTCLFRYHNRMLMGDGSLKEAFDLAMTQAGTQGTWTDLHPIQSVISRCGGGGFKPEHQRSLGLCYGIQRIAFMPGLLEAARKMAAQDLIDGFDAMNRVSQAGIAGTKQGIFQH